MIVSDRLRFVFVHNPKCAGTVFREAIVSAHDHPVTFWHLQPSPRDGRLLDFAHLRLWEVRDLFPDVYERLRSLTSLVFVRDPMRRFISALHHHFREHHPKVGVDGLGDEAKRSLFRHFVRSAVRRPQVLNDPRYVHFSPQRWFCAVGDEQVVEYVLPFDHQVLEVAGALVGIPSSTDRWRAENRPSEAILSDQVLHDFVRRFYAEDYAFLAQTPRLQGVSRGTKLRTESTGTPWCEVSAA